MSTPPRRAAAVVLAALLASATALVPSPARADRVDLETEPTISNRAVLTFGTDDPYIIDGESVELGEGTLGSRDDAFDGALVVGVNRTPLAARNGVVDVRGNRLDVGARSLAGLRVSSSYTALRGTSVLRLVVTLTNKGRRDLRRNVIVVNGLGSDNETVIEASSSQDTSFDRRDRWTVTSDGTADGDPVVGLVYGGRGGVAPRVRAENPDPDDFGVTTNVRVPGRSTRRLLLFANLSANVSGAVTLVDRFDGRRPPAFALAGLAPAVRRSVVNWDL